MRRKLTFPVLLLAGLAAIIAVACGGDDEPPPTPAPTEAATAAATEPPATEPPPAEAASVDAQYIRGVCIAGGAFEQAVLAAVVRLEQEGDDDPTAFAELFLEPIVEMVEALRGITPPDDMAEYHAASLAQLEQTVTVFEAMMEAAEDGVESEDDAFALLAMIGGGIEGAEGVPVISPATAARLDAVVEETPECDGVMFVEGFLGGVDAASAPIAVDPADEPYVRDLCAAGAAFEQDVLTAAVRLESEEEAGDDPPDPSVFAELFLEPVGRLIEALRAAAPPADMADYHAAVIEQQEGVYAAFQAMLEAAEDGVENEDDAFGLLALLGGGVEGAEGVVVAPGAAAARLVAVAEGIPDCQGSLFVQGFLGAVDGIAVDADPADVAYVRDLCIVGEAYTAAVLEKQASLGDGEAVDLSDPEVFAVVMTEPLRELAAEMRGISSPGDAFGYHIAVVTRYEEMVSLLDRITASLDATSEIAAADRDYFEELYTSAFGGSPLSDDTANRLAQAALNADECLGSGFLYAYLGGGG